MEKIDTMELWLAVYRLKDEDDLDGESVSTHIGLDAVGKTHTEILYAMCDDYGFNDEVEIKGMDGVIYKFRLEA